MIPELGHFALILAAIAAAILGSLPLFGAAGRIASWIRLARPAAQAQALLVVIAWGCLAAAFVGNDFSVANVAANSNSQLPLFYRVAATWGSHEGSMLLWVLMLSLWMLAVTLRSRHLPAELTARVLGVMGLVSFGFLLFVLVTSNPFTRLLPAPGEGADLNPLLQDPGMIAHPPLLYMGYVGFSVAFAFALAALLGGRLDATWARWSRPWTTVAWSFLTLGIVVGSWWAYHTLGWGGWWFWDPVENASLMPWLAGTALLHSLAVTEKRNAFRNWTVLIAICAFTLSLLGTFLVRSGVLTSVHAFVSDPRRGVFILVFLGLVVGASLVVYATRAPRVGAGGRFAPVSRESMLLVNNALLLAIAGCVLLGTLYPLFLDALGLGRISVGAPYFDAIFVPMIAPLLVLMGVGPLARWKEASTRELARRLAPLLAACALFAYAVPFAMGGWSIGVAFGLLLAAWILGTTVLAVRERLRHSRSLRARLAQQPPAFWGMVLAHVGVAVFVVGVTVLKGYQIERDVRMAPGDTLALGRDTLRFIGVSLETGPNYRAARAELVLERDAREVAALYPEKRRYNAGGMPTTNPAIAGGVLGDVYVALGEEAPGGAWVLRVYWKPFVTWLWTGFALMALGGFVAVADPRYRWHGRRAEQGDGEPAVAVLAGSP